MQRTKEKQDLTRLSWSVNRNSLGIGGSFLKAYSELGGTKTYYKPSNFDKTRGIIGHECVNELIVDRLLTILGIPHLPYQLIHADVSVDGRTHEVYLCASEDFKAKSESKTALDAYKELEATPDESALDFCMPEPSNAAVAVCEGVDQLQLVVEHTASNQHVQVAVLCPIQQLHD